MVIQTTSRTLNQVLRQIEKHYFTTNNNFKPFELRERWSTYCDIIHQIISINKTHIFHELYYRLGEDENLNSIFTDVINREDDLYLLLYPYINVLEEYLDFDDIRVFL